MPHPIDRLPTHTTHHHTRHTQMHLLTRPRSQPSPPSTSTTPELELSPPTLPTPPTPPQQPKAQGLKFFRPFSTRPLHTTDTDNLNPWETSPRAAARALRGLFGPPPLPDSSRVEGQAEYKWRCLEQERAWEGFLRSVEDEGGLGVPPPKSPASPRRVGGGNMERPRRSNSKSSDWDAAVLAHARSLGYSCPSSPSEVGSNGSVESLASESSGWSSSHAPSVSVLSPSIRSATYYRPTRSRSSSYSGGIREIKRPVASEDIVARCFAGVGPTEGSMLEGLKRGSKPKVMEVQRRDEAQSPKRQNALQLEVEARPQRAAAGTLGPAGPTLDTFAPVSRMRPTVPPSVTEASSRPPRDTLCPLTPAPRCTRSSTLHRTFRPSPLGLRDPSSVDSEDTKRRENPRTEVETVKVWKGKRRRHTTGGLKTIWETGSHRETAPKSAAVGVCSEAEGRNEA